MRARQKMCQGQLTVDKVMLMSAKNKIQKANGPEINI